MSDTPRTDQFSTTISEAYSNHCGAFKEMVHFSRSLEKQLAEKDKELEWFTGVDINGLNIEAKLAKAEEEIERMRPVIDAALGLYRSNSGISSMKFFQAIKEYEQSTKPDGGTET